MIIGIDAREIQRGVYTGIGRMVHDLIRYFEMHSDGDRLVLFAAEPLPFTFLPCVTVRVIPEVLTLWWDQVELPVAMKKEKIDVLYSPYYKVPLFTRRPRVAAVLDLIYLQYAEYRRALSPLAWLYHRTMGRACIHAARTIHTCSAFSCRDIMHVHGVRREKIAVVPLAVSDCYVPGADAKSLRAWRQDHDIPGRYVLYTGNFKPHKNVGALLEAFFHVQKRHADITLVLVGPKTAGYAALAQRVRALGLESNVVFAGVVKDEKISQLLYAGAEVFVMPSLYEGFGLPPAEAMACGTPVVCSERTSLPEVVGDAAISVDAADPGKIALALEDFLGHEALRRDAVRQGLERVVQFRPAVVLPAMLGMIRKAAS